MSEANNISERAAEFTQTIRTLARQADCDELVAPALDRLDDLYRETTQVTFVGGWNSGKSTLLNYLLDRSILPVTPLPSRLKVTIQGLDGAADECCLIDGQKRSLDELKGASLVPDGTPTVGATILLAVPWLREHRLSLVEHVLDTAGEDEETNAINDCLRGADILVLVMTSLAAVTRPEVALLNECLRRNVPTVVVLAKTDLLPKEDLPSLTEYVEKQVHSCVPESDVVVTAVTSSSHHGVNLLKESIDAILGRTDFKQVRYRQLTEVLLGALDLIRGAATAGLEAQHKTEAERIEDLRRRQREIDTQTIVWAEIDQKLQERRQKIDEQVRQHLRSNEESVTESLAHDLAGRSDVSTWWRRELPYRLQRELRNVATQISASVNRQISGDLRWLQEELLRQFKLPPAGFPMDTVLDIQVPEYQQKELKLWDTNKLRVISRLGMAASVVVAGRLLLTAGLGGATLGVSILAGLAAEQALSYTASKDRSKVRIELEQLIARASLEYAIDVSAKLKAGYDELVVVLREQQTRWQEAQLRAIRTIKGSGSFPDWKGILDQTAKLRQDMQRQVATSV